MLTPESVVLLAILLQAAVISIASSFRWGIQQLRLFQEYPPIDYPKFYVYSIKTEYILLSIRVLLDCIALFIVKHV